MRSHRRRILLLDANPARAPIARALEKAGFAVLVATEVAEALEIAANRALEAVIASAELPGIHALDLVASLRGVDAVRPVILYAASMTSELITAARDFRVTVLPGPVAAEMVVAALRPVLEPDEPARAVRRPCPPDRPASAPARSHPGRLRRADRRQPERGGPLRIHHCGAK